jgi:hypothetical protein
MIQKTLILYQNYIKNQLGILKGYPIGIHAHFIFHIKDLDLKVTIGFHYYFSSYFWHNHLTITC